MDTQTRDRIRGARRLDAVVVVVFVFALIAVGAAQFYPEYSEYAHASAAILCLAGIIVVVKNLVARNIILSELLQQAAMSTATGGTGFALPESVAMNAYSVTMMPSPARESPAPAPCALDVKNDEGSVRAEGAPAAASPGLSPRGPYA